MSRIYFREKVLLLARSEKMIVSSGSASAGNCGFWMLDGTIAFSYKGRSVCPSYNTRRTVETAAHLTDHIFPIFGFGNGCCRSRSGCATFCSAMAMFKTPPCASSYGSSSAAYSGAALTPPGWTRSTSAPVHRFGSSLNTRSFSLLRRRWRIGGGVPRRRGGDWRPAIEHSLSPCQRSRRGGNGVGAS